jgi:hypothetical protein
MHLDLSDAETAALTKELDDIAGNDRYPSWERRREQPQRRGADAIMSAAC